QGSTTFDLTTGGTSTLTLLNSNGTNVADLNLSDGSLFTNGVSRLTNGGALDNITGYTQTSGNFDASASNGTFKTSSGAVSINGETTIAATKNLTLTQGNETMTQGNLTLSNGLYSQTASSGANNTNLAAFNFTNGGSSGSVAINGLNIALTGISTTGSNTTTGINFPSVTPAGNNTFNGITFGSNYNNFITSPNITITGAGAITGGTGVTLVSGDITTPGNIFTSGSGTITSAGLLTGQSGLTVTGATNINTSGASATNIGTGTSTGTITLGRTTAGTTNLILNDEQWNIAGNGAANFPSIGATAPGTGAFTTLSSTGVTTLGNGSTTVAINSSTWDIDTLGAISGVTGYTQDSGNFTINGAGTISLGTGSNTNNVDIGNSTGTFSVTSTGLNVDTAGALTGVDSIDTIAISDTAITFAGSGTLAATTNPLNLQGDGSVDVNIAGGAAATGCTVTNTNGTLTCTGNIIGANTGTVGYLQRSAGALAPTNITDDLLLGATSTSSAKFAFINAGGGIPTASLSAGSNNNTYLTATGTLGTTNGQTLRLGGTSTGDVIISGRNASQDGIIFQNYGLGLIHSDASGRLTSSLVNLETDVLGILPSANGGSPFDAANGAIFERNTTQDFLLGGQSTA